MRVLIGWLFLTGVAGIGALWFLFVENVKLRRRVKQFEKVHKEAREVCGHDWCDQSEDSVVHGLVAGRLDEGQHKYVPAMLVLDVVPLIQIASRDKAIFLDWKITDRKEK